MTGKYCRIALVMFLCVAMLTLSASAAVSKSQKKARAHRKSAAAKVIRSSYGPLLQSAAVLVKDQSTGRLLIQKRTMAVVPIASITKLMTAMVVLDQDENLQGNLVIQDADMDRIRHSHSRLPVGTILTRREAMLLALMSSENRCAHALGRTYLGGTRACVAAMNAKARALGLSSTRFADTSGLANGNVSSARDLAKLVEAAYQYDVIREFTTCRETTLYSGQRILEYRNSNLLVKDPDWDIGLSKTGYTDEAGRCLVMLAHVANRPLLIVLLDSQGRLTRVGDANRIKKWLEGPSQVVPPRKG
ncbi:MAG: D-alanyl-D-alanine carboxypeptidase [Deltaproteobacteria bacterium]|nr:D-alanyl-D-alanine carboxypeptidase [Deltaproteobacteria bacterium]